MPSTITPPLFQTQVSALEFPNASHDDALKLRDNPTVEVVCQDDGRIIFVGVDPKVVAFSSFFFHEGPELFNQQIEEKLVLISVRPENLELLTGALEHVVADIEKLGREQVVKVHLLSLHRL